MRRRLFFNLWYFLRRPQWDTGISPPELCRFIETHPAGRALDLGCGTGTNVITLAKAGWQVTGVDFAARALALARRKARAAHLFPTFRAGDVTRARFPPQAFDLILDSGCFHGLPERRAEYARHVQNWLSPEGTFLLYGVLYRPDFKKFGLTDQDLALFSSLTLLRREDGVNPGPVARPPCGWNTKNEIYVMVKSRMNTRKKGWVGDTPPIPFFGNLTIQPFVVSSQSFGAGGVDLGKGFSTKAHLAKSTPPY